MIINVHLVCDTLLYGYVWLYGLYDYMTTWTIVGRLEAYNLNGSNGLNDSADRLTIKRSHLATPGIRYRY